MKKSVIWVLIFLAGTISLLFQNCSGNKFVQRADEMESSSESDPIQTGTGDKDKDGGLVSNNNPSCDGGVYVWKVGKNSCQGGYDSLKNQNGFKTLSDNLAPTTGKVSIACLDGKVVEILSEGKTCINTPVGGVNAVRPVLEKNVITMSDRTARLYTGVSAANGMQSNTFYYCIQEKGKTPDLCKGNGNSMGSGASQLIYTGNTAEQTTFALRSLSNEIVIEWNIVKALGNMLYSPNTIAPQGAKLLDYEIYIHIKPSASSQISLLGKFDLSIVLPELDVQTKTNETYKFPLTLGGGSGYQLVVDFWCRDSLNATVFPAGSSIYTQGFGPENQERQCVYKISQEFVYVPNPE